MNSDSDLSCEIASPGWLMPLLAFYGYFLNILGPITPFLKEELELSYTVSSLHFTAFAVGILLIGLSGQLVITAHGALVCHSGSEPLECSVGAFIVLLASRRCHDHRSRVWHGTDRLADPGDGPLAAL